MWATEPRSIASTPRSIFFGSITRSKNQVDEQSANRSSSVTLKGDFAESSASTRGWRSRVVAREGAPRALELAAPAVRRREPLGLVRLGRREQRQRAQPLALGRRLLELPA